MNLQQLETDIRDFVRQAYPNIEVRVEPWTADPTRQAVYFTEAQFASLYPAQRYHYLRHLIPADYYERHLTNSEWFELAPGERPEDLEYPDAELIADITRTSCAACPVRGSSRRWTTCSALQTRRVLGGSVTATIGMHERSC